MVFKPQFNQSISKLCAMPARCAYHQYCEHIDRSISHIMHVHGTSCILWPYGQTYLMQITLTATLLLIRWRTWKLWSLMLKLLSRSSKTFCPGQIWSDPRTCHATFWYGIAVGVTSGFWTAWRICIVLCLQVGGRISCHLYYYPSLS